MLAPYNILVSYRELVFEGTSKIDSHEYEWGPNPLSEASTKEEEEEAIRIQKMELEEIRLKRKEAYERQQREKKVSQNQSPKGKENDVSPSSHKLIRCSRTIEELEDDQA